MYSYFQIDILYVFILQIVGIDGIMVRDFEHIAVVKMFQTKDKLELALLPAKFKAVS